MGFKVFQLFFFLVAFSVNSYAEDEISVSNNAISKGVKIHNKKNSVTMYGGRITSRNNNQSVVLFEKTKGGAVKSVNVKNVTIDSYNANINTDGDAAIFIFDSGNAKTNISKVVVNSRNAKIKGKRDVSIASVKSSNKYGNKKTIKVVASGRHSLERK